MVSISVIIPIYNVQKYLARCLESICNQEFEDYEVILINDGSTDNSLNIAEIYIERYQDKIKLINQKNGGLSAARNKGLLHAEGKYVCFIDSDDYVEKTYLSEMYEVAEKNDADLVFCAFKSVDENGKVIKYIRESRLISEKVYSLKENEELFLIQNAAWNKLYRKDIIEECNLYFTPEVWYEDLRFTKKYLLNASKCVYCDKALYNYLQRSGSIMNTQGEKNLEILGAIEEVINYYKERNVYEKYRKVIEFVAIDHIFISCLVRVLCYSKDKLLYKNIRKQFEKSFPLYKKNIYIKGLEKNRKIVYYLLRFRLLFLIKLIFRVKN